MAHDASRGVVSVTIMPKRTRGGGLRNHGKHVTCIVYSALPNCQLMPLSFLPT